MFRTYKHAELELLNVFGSDYQMWHFVELAMHRPWFYAGTREGEGDDTLVTMKMIPNVEVLQCLLSEHSDAEIETIQVLSPGYVNGTPLWKMEILIGLGVLVDESGRASGYRYSVEGGISYDVLDASARGTNFQVKKTVFSRP